MTFGCPSFIFSSFTFFFSFPNFLISNINVLFHRSIHHASQSQAMCS
jgi:hypothetical protein